jgi:hypothetical protein
VSTEEKPPVTPPADDKKAGPDPTEGYRAALKSANDNTATLAQTLYAEAARLRGELAEARGKAPKDGAVVLAGDDAAAWAEFAQLGKPGEVRAAIEAGTAAAARVKAFEREKLVGAAAQLHGLDAEVLADKAGPDLRIEIADVVRNGKAAKVRHRPGDGRHPPGRLDPQARQGRRLRRLGPRLRRPDLLVSDTAGAVADAAGTTSQVVGKVVPMSDSDLTKVIYFDFPWLT